MLILVSLVSTQLAPFSVALSSLIKLRLSSLKLRLMLKLTLIFMNEWFVAWATVSEMESISEDCFTALPREWMMSCYSE